jgi:hypothetical protein
MISLENYDLPQPVQTTRANCPWCVCRLPDKPAVGKWKRYKNGALSAIDLRIVQDNYQRAALENNLAMYARYFRPVDSCA